MIRYIAFGIFLLIIVLSLAGSFFLTRRFRLKDARTPAELGLPYEQVAFLTKDHLTLRGWLVPGADLTKVVVLLHGHSGSIDYDIDYIPYLRDKGYSVLQFDFRGHGRSDGRMVTFGCLEQADIQAAAGYLSGRGFTRIALLGFSLGGMCALTGAPLSPEVNVVIDDGGPIRLSSALLGWCREHQLADWVGKIAAPLVLGATSLRLGQNFWAFEPVRWAGKIAPRPLMLIHGEKDPFVTDFDDLLTAAKPTEVWRMPEEGHVTAVRGRPEEYWQRVTAFLDTYL